MSTSTLMGGITPAQWRALNALFYAGSSGMNALTLRDAQRIEWPHLAGLESGEYIAAWLGPKTQVKLADMTGASHVLRIRLTDRGRRRVASNRANQVVCTLGGQPGHTARVRDCKAEGTADDDLLRKMGEAGLVVPDEPGAWSLSMFKRLPRDLKLHLTAKGRGYFPLDMVGASA